jgi:hypothetical protein
MMAPVLRLRANPELQLKRLAELTPEEREPFRELESDAEFYGLLVPRAPGSIGLKSVSSGAAELFRSLAEPRELPADAEIVAQILDGVLQIASGVDFVSGADAFSIVSPSRSEPVCNDLSRSALLHAQDLETAGATDLARSLYLFNRIPITPFWHSRFPGPAAVVDGLGADRAPLRRLIEQHWRASHDEEHWLRWTSKSRRRRRSDEVTWKLYVSPRPERIREAFEILVRILGDFPDAQFKLGNSAGGLLRPDKMVAYFLSREQLLDAAGRLAHELAGCESQGVPFTAAVDSHGLVSWGVDPPADDAALRWMGRTSWRLWLVQRLGAALAIAKHARTPGAIEPWRFAVERVRLHGVDAGTWTPADRLWSRA